VRGPAAPGVRHRHALLDRMRVQGSGYDTIAYDFQYAQPTMHSVGRFLVGFDRVTRKEGDLPSAPTGTNVMSFLNGDNWGGLLLSGRQTDGRLPDVVKVEERAYADASFQGLPFKRLAQSASGWTSADGTKRAVDVTTYDTYEGAFCPSQQTLTTANHGTLVTRTTRANPADLANHLHCLEARIVRSGAHGDGALDFGDERTIARDSAGLVTQIAAVGPDGPMVEEQVAYDSDHDPLRISVPGKGTTAIEYDPATKLPAKVTTPDGVSRIASRDAVTDATLTVLIDRGGSRSTDFASYDGQERLASHWSDLDASSALAPDQRYEYSYASTNHPATLTAHTLVDAATGVYRHTTELYTAANEKMAAAQLHGSGWVFDGLVARSRARRLEEHVQIANQPAATSFASIDYATLLRSNGGSLPVATASTTSSTLAMDVATATRFHVDVTKATTTTLAVTGDGQLSRATLVNGTNATTALLDPTGKLQLGYVDEAQTTYGYAYDALGRLRVVTLPDGARHRVTYDAYGRQSAIVRDGVERIENKYLAVPGSTTDLLLTKVITPVSSSSASSTPARAIAWTYDAAGRKVVERHTDLTSAAETAFTFFYDGSTPAAPTASGAAGLLTGVSGDGYTKAFTYRADGKLTHREVALTGFRTIAMDITYREDGTSLDEKIVVMDPQGNVLQRSTHRQEVDTFGRPSTTSWNGAPLLTTAYDDLGRPSTALFSTGDSVSLAYDDLTRNLIGFDQTRAAGAWAGVASTRTKRDDRGFVGREVLGIGPLSVERTYSYSPQGFLTLAIDGVRQ
jgi:YD repeat-containing protein